MTNRYEPDAEQVSKGVVYYSKPIVQLTSERTEVRITSKTTGEPVLEVEESVEEVPTVVETTEKSETETETETETVPEDLSVKKTLAWVGDDVSRAESALKSEEGREEPRSTLLKGLKEIVDNG